MNEEQISLIVFAGLLFLLASGMWVSVVAGVLGILLLVLFVKGGMVTMLGPLQFNSINSFTWTAVPLFIFMGEIILHSGISDRLYKGANRWIGALPGGLLHTNILACALFAALSGSSVATAAAIGTVAVPELLRRGYDRKLLLGSLAAGGTLGILIPPSIAFIVYGGFVNESIAALFISGIIPGIILSGLFMSYIGIVALIRPSIMPERSKFSLKALASSIVDIWPVLVLIFMVMGTIYLGVATPTEAAALGCFISLVLAALFRNLTWQILKNALLSGVKVTSFVMLIVVGAQALSMGLSFLEVPARLVYITTSFSSNPLVILAMVTLLYIILGMFIEATSMLLLTLPLVYPILKALGFNSIWLGVYFVIMVEMAQITPPVGINLYVIHGIAERKYMGDIMWGIVPFFFCQLALIVLIIAFPDLVLWLPAQMVRKF